MESEEKILLKRIIVLGIVLIMVVGCSNETSKSQESVEEEMTEVLEDGKEIVVEPFSESEEDVIKRMKLEAELKSIIADITSFEEETITLMLSLHSEPSCSIVLGIETTIENTVIEEIKQNIIQTVLKGNVTIGEENIVITNSNGEILQ